MMPPLGEAPPMASSPCTPEQAIKEFLDRLTTPCRLLIAFSGGGDSTGLLASLSDACRLRTDITLHSATVDHGLRSGSFDEAVAAGAVSREMGVAHTILQWAGEKPSTGIQAAARDARYSLLAQEARRVGADFIVTGHNLDDQDETVFMRQQRNPDAAEGMDEAVLVMRRVWVLRPLLAVGREAIRAHLRVRNLGWVDDPSNDNLKFERVRVRMSGSAGGDARRRSLLPNPYVEAAAFVDEGVRMLAGPVAVVDLERYRADHQPHWIAIATLAAVMGGRVHGPDSVAARAMLLRLAEGRDFRATVNRVLFDRRGTSLYLHREARGLPTVAIAPGQTVCWDGRYEIVNEGTSPVRIGAGRGVTEAARLLPGDEQAALPRDLSLRLDATTPRILDGDGTNLYVCMRLAPFERFLPARKLDLANSLARLVDSEQFPSL
jgi:tRNA(Ile)-lysidine synthase